MARLSAFVLLLTTTDLVPASRMVSRSSMRNDDIALLPANETTGRGCTCDDAPCGASLAQHHKCDWCETPKGCGEHVFTRGWFDFCDFKPPDAFTSMTHQEKTNTLWRQVVADRTPGPLMGFATTLVEILTVSMVTTFDNAREVNPKTRVKVIHGQGAMLQFDLEVRGDSPYTGMLMPGVHRGLMRLGSAIPPDMDVFPGIAIKFLRSGIHSANSVLLRHSGELQGKLQFFEVNKSNHVTPPGALAALNKFNQASGCQPMTGLSDMCSYTQDGSLVPGDPRFPYEIRFDAVDPMQFPMDYSLKQGMGIKPTEVLRALTTIPKGTHLYNVVAKESPLAPWRSLGKVVTRSESTTSHFGDTELSFRHQRMEEDFIWHPDWVEHADGDLPFCSESKNRKGELRPISDWQCPFATGVGLHPSLPPQ